MLNNISNKKLFREVKELQLPMRQYVLFGSAPLGIRRGFKMEKIVS